VHKVGTKDYRFIRMRGQRNAKKKKNTVVLGGVHILFYFITVLQTQRDVLYQEERGGVFR